MIHENRELLRATDEQNRYAVVLAWGTRVGFVALALAFLAYLLEWLPPHVPFADLPALWSQPVGHYLAATGSPTGWSWLALAHRGDFASLLGVAILAGASVTCLVAVMPAFAARRDRVFVALCGLEVAVLLLAASGVLTGGH
jgi:hypothetical protein